MRTLLFAFAALAMLASAKNKVVYNTKVERAHCMIQPDLPKCKNAKRVALLSNQKFSLMRAAAVGSSQQFCSSLIAVNDTIGTRVITTRGGMIK